MWYVVMIFCYSHVPYISPPLTDQAATAAIEAGKRRKDLARSVASSAASTGSSSGKRSHVEVKPTDSTKVTPEAKVPCVLGDMMEPRQLDFSNGGVEGWVLKSYCISVL